MMLLEEMASIFLTPYLLLFVVPKVFVLSEIVYPFYFGSSKLILFWSWYGLCFVLQRVEDILQFIADFTEHVDGVGDVCRLVNTIHQQNLLSFSSSSGFLVSSGFFLSLALTITRSCSFFFPLSLAAALAPLIFKNMAIVIMDLPTMQVAPRGALRGKWRSPSWGTIFSNVS